MWLRDLLWLVPSGAGTTAMAWRSGWLAALAFLIVASALSWLTWEVRRTRGASKLLKNEMIPALDAFEEWITRSVKRRAGRRKLKVREQQRLRALEAQGEGPDL